MYVIVGPTACGKTAKAVALARHLGGEIVSADSRQLYCGMDIGTGKDLDEYGTVPYHLINICPAGYRYNLFEYVRDFSTVEADLQARQVPMILCGGTGLYVETILKGIQLPPVPANEALRLELQGKTLAELTHILQRYKTLHNTTDVDTTKRAIRAIEIAEYYHLHPDLKDLTTPHPRTDFVLIGLAIDREQRRTRITERLHSRLNQGMIAEVKTLLDSGLPPDDLLYYGLEYKFVTQYLMGQLSYDEMVSQLEIAIHQFAKRQMTWFRGMERRGYHIHWLPYDLAEADFLDQVEALSKRVLNANQ